MKILTVKFSKNGKTYDYLLRNPKKITIDKNKPLHYISGISAAGQISQPIFLVSSRSEDNLPLWVISQMEIQENNLVFCRKIPPDDLTKLRNLVAPLKPIQKKEEKSIALPKKRSIIKSTKAQKPKYEPTPAEQLVALSRKSWKTIYNNL